VSALGAAGAKLRGLFVADPWLAAFVPAWVAAAWAAVRLSHLPPPVLAGLLACGPMAALWCSVHAAARAIRRARQVRP
jgi:hypothetical protein